MTCIRCDYEDAEYLYEDSRLCKDCLLSHLVETGELKFNIVTNYYTPTDEYIGAYDETNKDKLNGVYSYIDKNLEVYKISKCPDTNIDNDFKNKCIEQIDKIKAEHPYIAYNETALEILKNLAIRIGRNTNYDPVDVDFPIIMNIDKYTTAKEKIGLQKKGFIGGKL